MILLINDPKCNKTTDRNDKYCIGSHVSAMFLYQVSSALLVP